MRVDRTEGGREVWCEVVVEWRRKEKKGEGSEVMAAVSERKG